MVYTNDDVTRLAKRASCPRCDLNKTIGNALCRRCRSKLPENMRTGLESVGEKDWMSVGRALRAAANYFNVHYQSIRNFGGGRKR